MRSGVRLVLVALAAPALVLGSAVTATATDAPVPTAASCAVDDATITWGFKESFRSYISGAIANGQWAVSGGAEYETPDFRFGGGSGLLDRSAGVGSVEFPGAVTFTGHGGILNTTIEKPVIEFRDDSGALYFDVNGTTQDGAEVDARMVEFVTLALDAGELAERTDDRLTIRDVPATLTDAGAEAFGTYQAGEPFDPVTIELTFDGECEAPAETNWWLVGGLALGAAAALVAALVWYRVRRYSEG
ncbi:HtaA domain-containing protein [Homoserinimonas sp. A447]